MKNGYADNAPCKKQTGELFLDWFGSGWEAFQRYLKFLVHPYQE